MSDGAPQPQRAAQALSVATLLPTEDEALLAEAARGFLSDASPVSKLRALRDAGETADPALWRKMADQGFTAVIVPEAAGGLGMGHRAAGILAEEMGRVLASSPFISTAVMAATALAPEPDRFGERLAGIASGELVYAVAVDEGAKHAPEATTLAAAPDGNGFRLTGNKTFVADALQANRALVLARTGGERGDPTGLTLFDIALGNAGIERARQNTVDARDHARLAFDGVAATGDDVVGEVGAGLAALGPALNAGRAATAAELAGLASAAFRMTVDYLKERKQFDRPIGSFQALQHRAAQLWCELEVTRSAIINAGRMLDEAPQDAQLAVSLAKARAAETAQLAVSEAVQMHGGIGMTDDYDVGFFMKRARVAAEWLGDAGYHAAIVARARGF